MRKRKHEKNPSTFSGSNNSQSPKSKYPNEIHLRRLPVEEALFRLNNYLDKVFIAGITSVRIIHGKGSGSLRSAVRDTLSAHPLVKGYREGHIGEGDAGVTVADIQELQTAP